MIETEVVRIPAQPGRAEELATALSEARSDGYLTGPRCVALRALVSERGDEVIAVVDWRSRNDHDEALKEPAAGELFEKVAELAAGEPALGWYRVGAERWS